MTAFLYNTHARTLSAKLSLLALKVLPLKKNLPNTELLLLPLLRDSQHIFFFENVIHWFVLYNCGRAASLSYSLHGVSQSALNCFPNHQPKQKTNYFGKKIFEILQVLCKYYKSYHYSSIHFTLSYVKRQEFEILFKKYSS